MHQVDLEQLKGAIASAAISAELKERLLKSFPALGRATLAFIERAVSRRDFPENAEALAQFCAAASGALAELKRGQPQAAAELLKGSLENPDFEFGRYAVPLAQDVRPFTQAYPQLLDALLAFEREQLVNLPTPELHAIVRENILSFVRNMDAVTAFKRVYYPFSDEEGWGEGFVFDLERSEEQLGDQPLEVDGTQQQPTVRAWLRDYAASVGKPILQRTTFDQIQYLKNSPNAGRLSERQRADLLEILKLHQWFYDPVVTEQDVREFEGEGNAPRFSAPPPVRSERPAAPAQTPPPPPPAKAKVLPGPPPAPKAQEGPRVFAPPMRVPTVRPVAQAAPAVRQPAPPPPPRPAEVPGAPTPPPRPQEPPKATQPTAVNIQDILNQKRSGGVFLPGVKIGGTQGQNQLGASNLDIEQLKAEAEKKRREHERRIDEKLDQLRKKMNP